ncbi:MAG: class I SAM-dependent methyltransferase [Halobacteriota archaeon]
MASMARQRGMQVYEARAEALPFADASFDSVLMVTTICFFSDPLQALQETRKALKPQGHIVIGMSTRTALSGSLMRRKRVRLRFIDTPLLLRGTGDRLARATGILCN